MGLMTIVNAHPEEGIWNVATRAVLSMGFDNVKDQTRRYSTRKESAKNVITAAKLFRAVLPSIGRLELFSEDNIATMCAVFYRLVIAIAIIKV